MYLCEKNTKRNKNVINPALILFLKIKEKTPNTSIPNNKEIKTDTNISVIGISFLLLTYKSKAGYIENNNGYKTCGFFIIILL